MLLKFNLPHLYVCNFSGENKETLIQKFSPGINKIDDKISKFLLKHPGIKARLDAGTLQIVGGANTCSKPKIHSEIKEEVKIEIKKEVKPEEKAEQKAQVYRHVSNK